MLLARDWVSHEREVLEVPELAQRHDLAEVLERVVRQHECMQKRQRPRDVLVDARHEVIREDQVLEAHQAREVPHVLDFIIGKIERVVLVARHTEVFKHDNL